MFKDCVHGDLHLDDWYVTNIIDTTSFQRLRDILQNGAVTYVFPGATHSRFEHSLGVSHLARTTLTRLQKLQPDLEITDREILLVGLAGLLHDVGHGPFSHAFEKIVVPHLQRKDKERRWHHEHMSEEIFDYIIQENKLEIAPSEVQFVKDLISGNRERAESGKHFLFDIVANSRNSIDVDKVDYLARDSYQIGKLRMDFTSVFQNCRVIGDEICFRKKDMYSIFQILNSRFEMHKTVYSNPTVQAVEIMLMEATLKANSVLKIESALHNPQKFIRLSDSIIKFIELAEDHDGRLKQSKKIIHRIRTREIYKLAAERTVHSKELFTELIKEGNLESLNQAILDSQSGTRVLKAGDFTCYPMYVDFGMKDKNPLKHVGFYEDSKPDIKHHYCLKDFTVFLSDYCCEYTLRIFCTDPTPEKLLAIRMAFEVYCHNIIADELVSPVSSNSEDSCNEDRPSKIRRLS